jgi:hypothetical protein
MDPKTAGDVIPRPRFIVGSWLGRTLKVCCTGFPHLLFATLIVMVPMFALEWAMTRGPSTRPVRAFSPILVRVFFQAIESGVGFVVQGIVVMLVFQRLRRHRIDAFRSIRVGLSRLPVLLGIVVCVVLAVSVCAIPGGMLAHSVPWLVVSVLLAMIPYVIWFVASTAAVVERVGVLRSLARSARLTKGRRFQIFAAFAVLLLLAAAIGRSIDWASAQVFGPSPPTGSAPGESLRELCFRGIGAVLGGMMGSVLPIVIYHDLRATKEGIGLEQLASVFDRHPPAPPGH